MERLTIGALARAAGVPVSTLRYYERAGLLAPEGRTAANYRLYGTDALERLRFIRAARASGFTLDDVQLLSRLRGGARSPCNQEVQALLQRRLGDTRRRMEELRRVEATLTSALKACRRSERQGRCQVMLGLEQAADGKHPRKSP